MNPFLAKYAEAVFPDTTLVFGRRLEPLTIGQMLLLYRIGSPFVVGGKMPGDSDLVLALYVLTRPFREAAGLLLRWRKQSAAGGAQRGGEKLPFILRVWSWQLGVRANEAQRVAALVTIGRHLDVGLDGPPLWEGQGKPAASPGLQGIKVKLQARLGVGSEAALNYPLRQALWDLACQMESDGKADWVDPEDAAAIAGAGRAPEEAAAAARN